MPPSVEASFVSIQLRKMANSPILNLMNRPQRNANLLSNLFPGNAFNVEGTNHIRFPLLQEGNVVTEPVLLPLNSSR